MPLQIHSSGLVDATQPLWQKLSMAVNELMLERPMCFLCPGSWALYRPVLSSCTENQDTLVRAHFQAMCQRNTHFIRQSATEEASNEPQQQIIGFLDSFDWKSDMITVSRMCLATTRDLSLLIHTVVAWAATRFRPGLSRVYLAARLIRRWCKRDVELESRILSGIAEYSDPFRFERERIYKLICELIRSHQFSISRLLQWIMARGVDLKVDQFSFAPATGAGSSVFPRSSGSWEREFILELLCSIPLHGLPDHTLNLREMILKPHHPNVPSSAKEFAAVKLALSSGSRIFPAPQLDKAEGMSAVTRDYLKQFDTPARFELLNWVRETLLSHVSAFDSGPVASRGVYSAAPFLSTSDFEPLYLILEAFEDFAFLADVLCMFAEHGDISLLTDLAEITSKHFDVLHALGAAEDVYETLLQRTQEVTTRSVGEKPLMLALINLTRMFPKRRKTLHLLERELGFCEPKSALAACSPTSDIVDEVFQGPSVTFMEEVEFLFSSGTTMDRSTVSRLFVEVTSRLEPSRITPAQSASLIEILARICYCSPEYFEELLLSWLESICWGEISVDLRAVLPMLTCRAVVDLPSFLRKVWSAKDKVDRITSKTLVEILSILVKDFEHSRISVSLPFQPPAAETYLLQRLHHCHNAIEAMIHLQPDMIASVIRTAVDRIAASPSAIKETADKILFTKSFSQILWHIARSASALSRLYDESQDVTSCALLARITGHALGLDDSEGSASGSSTERQANLCSFRESSNILPNDFESA